MTPVLETSRLWLRPLELADADQIQQIFPQWEIVRYLTAAVPWPYPPDGALTFCRDEALPAVARGESWAWTIRLKSEPDRVVGVIQLMVHPSNNRGFWIEPRCQGRGLMTEACDAATDYWFNTLNFPVLRAPKAGSNLASRRISEKQGMRLVAVEEGNYVSGRLPTEVWEITREEWQARQRTDGPEGSQARFDGERTGVTFTIRRAVASDVAAACDVVRRSITELCVQDHKGDAATIDAWLASKTEADFTRWIGSDKHVALVAEELDRVLGFGLMTRAGMIALLYVLPDARFHGVSKALLTAMEDAARSLGVRTVTLDRTGTAKRFYERAGYTAAGAPKKGFGISTCYPMSKQLAP